MYCTVNSSLHRYTPPFLCLILFAVFSVNVLAIDRFPNARVVSITVQPNTLDTQDENDELELPQDRLRRYAERIGDQRNAEMFNNSESGNRNNGKSELIITLSFEQPLPVRGASPFIYFEENRIGIPVGLPTVSDDGEYELQFLLSNVGLINNADDSGELKISIQYGDDNRTRSEVSLDSIQLDEIMGHVDNLNKP